jgi:hypothetical protein
LYIYFSQLVNCYHQIFYGTNKSQAGGATNYLFVLAFVQGQVVAAAAAVAPLPGVCGLSFAYGHSIMYFMIYSSIKKVPLCTQEANKASSE